MHIVLYNEKTWFTLKEVWGDGCKSNITEQGQRMVMLRADGTGSATLCTVCGGQRRLHGGGDP